MNDELRQLEREVDRGVRGLLAGLSAPRVSPRFMEQLRTAVVAESRRTGRVRGWIAQLRLGGGVAAAVLLGLVWAQPTRVGWVEPVPAVAEVGLSDWLDAADATASQLSRLTDPTEILESELDRGEESELDALDVLDESFSALEDVLGA